MKNGFDKLVRSMTKAEINTAASALLFTLTGESGVSRETSYEAAEEMKKAPEKRTKPQNILPEESTAPEDNADDPAGASGEKSGEDGTEENAAQQKPGQSEIPAAVKSASDKAASDSGNTRTALLDDAAESYAAGEPHRRYENSVGRRELEMNRVSRYFSRDGRRYDTGFERY